MELTIVYRELDRLKTEAASGSISGQQLARFLDELKGTLQVLGQVAYEGYTKAERLENR